LKIVVANQFIGNVIGKKGANIKEIRDSTGCRVNISDSTPYAQDRVVTLRGTYEAVQAASALVNQRVEESQAQNGGKPQVSSYGQPPPMMDQGGYGYGAPATGVLGAAPGGYGVPPGYGGYAPQPAHGGYAPQPETEIKLLVPNGQAGGLIGKGGCTIKEIRETSGARIKMAQASEMPIGSTERLVTITGSMACVQAAQQIISQKLSEIPNSVPAYHQSGFGANGFSSGSAVEALAQAGYNLGGGYNAGYNTGVPHVPVSAVQVSIPNDTMGRIIGRGGASINEIRQVSGCKIDIADLEPGATARVLTITGPPEGAQMAQYLISVKMMQSQQYQE
jgi:transcription antitermination factor NusA-like protein